MPGNEVGDRVHNFFDQDNLSQSQHDSQVVEGNWPVLSNNLWDGIQRQTSAPLISGFKNYNVQHPDSERGVSSQSMRMPHGLNWTQSTAKPESAKSQSQNQPSNLNGYMHDHHPFQTRHTDANFLGCGSIPDRHYLASRGLYNLETPQRNGPEHKKDSMSLEAHDSPVKFDFLGAQPQMSNQKQGMLQSLPRQQSGFSDVQLLQQQAVIRQMQELQMQQQIQEQVRHQNSLSHISSMGQQADGNNSPVQINGTHTPIHGGPNYGWTPELTSGNTNWLQCGALPVMQGSSNGLMCPPEQGQTLRMMGLTPQGVDQSFYGAPISSTRGTSAQYSHDNIDKSTMKNLSTSNNSFTRHQYDAPRDGASICRQGFDADNLSGNSLGQGLGSMAVTEYDHPTVASVQEFRQTQKIADSSGTLLEKSMMQVASSQSVVPLDPTEEKILFGSDDNIWDAFGKTTNMGPGGYNVLDGADFPNAFPSMQSGSWSALMQSAVAETSGGDTGLQDEWSGLTFSNSELPSGSHQSSVFSSSGKQQTVWADNNLQTATSSVPRPFLLSDDANRITNYSTVTRKGNLVPDSTVELEHGKHDSGTLPVNRGDSDLNNVASIWNLSSTKGDRDNNQQLSNNHHIEYGKHVEVSSEVKGGEGFGKYQHHLNNRLQVLEPSVNSSENGVVDMPNMDNSNKKENSSGSHHSKSSHHASLAGLRENVGRKSSGSRKFHYHPMGNLDEDVEPYYGKKLSTLSQATSQLGTRGLNSHDQGSSVQSKFKETKKERSLESQVDGKGVDEVPSRSRFTGYVSNTSAPFDRPTGIYAPMKTAQSSQNILELLHKADQSGEHGGMTHISTSEHNLLSEMPEGENSVRFEGHLQRNHSSAFQGFGLQLAPPSQRLPSPNRALCQVAPETGDRDRTWIASTAMLPSTETLQDEFQNNKNGIQGQTNKETSSYNVQGNFSAAFSSGFPYPRSQHQNQHMTSSSGQLTTDQSTDIDDSFFNCIDDSCDRVLAGPSVPVSLPETAGSTPHNNVLVTADMSNNNQSRVPAQQIPEPVSEPALKPGMSQQGTFSTELPNAWTNVSTQQRLLGAQPHQASSSLFNSSLQSNINVETTPSTPQKGDNQDTQRGNGPFESGACSMSSHSFVHEAPTKESPWRQASADNIDSVQKATVATQGKESTVNHHSDSSVPNDAATQKDIETFGRSLKPDSQLHKKYSLLHQMKAMKSIETDPSNRNLKRFKGPDCGLNGQLSSYGLNTMVRDASINRSQLRSGDSNMPNFSSVPGDYEDKKQLGNTSSQDMLAYGRNNSPNEASGNDVVSRKYKQINPQMAPSWFNQFGTFENVKIFPIHDAQKTATLKPLEQPNIGKIADSLHTRSQTEQVDVAADSQVIDVRQNSTLIALASEHIPSPLSLLPAVTDQSLVALRPKKRKSATSGLLPWHKEVSQGSQRLLTISMAEASWAEAANRLVEKAEEKAETMIDDGPLMLGPKRRLIMTTQFMQQLIHPPPASVLTADSSSNYENMAYFVARLTLGDACSQVSCSGSHSRTLPDSQNLLLEKLKTSHKIGKQYYLKVVEDFIGRAKRLEADLLRLDKKTSILDLRVECQDLEKFSVINRFAKFHGRGQADGAESSSFDATINTQKFFPNRYVTALPMPRNLPDRVQCHSL